MICRETPIFKNLIGNLNRRTDRETDYNVFNFISYLA